MLALGCCLSRSKCAFVQLNDFSDFLWAKELICFYGAVTFQFSIEMFRLIPAVRRCTTVS